MTEEQLRVLVVDDEESVRSLLQRILEARGYNVITAPSGAEALHKIDTEKIDAVILDIKMPGMSGMEVLRQLVTNHPHICVIMVTAVGDAQTAVEAMKMGASDYITKPFNQDDIVLKLQKAVSKINIELREGLRHLKLEDKVAEQTEQLQRQFIELVETLAREHKLIYRLTQTQDYKAMPSRLPPELQKPMSSVEEFVEALLRILGRGALRQGDRTHGERVQGSKEINAYPRGNL